MLIIILFRYIRTYTHNMYNIYIDYNYLYSARQAHRDFFFFFVGLFDVCTSQIKMLNGSL